MPSAELFSIAFIGGLLPSLIWLWFWLREDSLHPEPKRLIILTFLAGAAVVPLVLFAEKGVCVAIGETTCRISRSMEGATLFLLISWAIIEEGAKLLAASAAVLWRKEVDEPIDPVMYLITAALGFSAVENALFIMKPLTEGDLAASILTGNSRFLGAMVLHVLASAIIGVALAFAFYKKASSKHHYLIAGFIGAAALHTLFNFFIIQASGRSAFLVFTSVWVGGLVLILIFEKIKHIRIPWRFGSKHL